MAPLPTIVLLFPRELSLFAETIPTEKMKNETAKAITIFFLIFIHPLYKNLTLQNKYSINLLYYKHYLLLKINSSLLN